MKILVVGAGAMGCAFAARVRSARHDVWVYDIRSSVVDAINANGIDVFDSMGWQNVSGVLATADAASLPEVDYCIFLCKSFATADAAKSVSHALGADGVAITLQNGLGNAEVLAAQFGSDRVIAGTTTVGAREATPARVVLATGTAHGGSTTFLCSYLGGTPPPSVLRLASVLNGAHLHTECRESVHELVWSKLSISAAMAPVCALVRRTIEDIVNDPHSYGTVRTIFDEVIDVAAADGASLDREELWSKADAIHRSMGPHHASMADDVVNGRKTEIDALVLQIVLIGKRHAVPTPTLEAVGNLILAMEGSYSRSL